MNTPKHKPSSKRIGIESPSTRTSTKEPRFVSQTLAWCNSKRREKKLKPLKQLPKGKRSDGQTCPCGAATNLYVSTINFYPTISDFTPLGRLPSSVQTFVKAFDKGKLPQYEL